MFRCYGAIWAFQLDAYSNHQPATRIKPPPHTHRQWRQLREAFRGCLQEDQNWVKDKRNDNRLEGSGFKSLPWQRIFSLRLSWRLLLLKSLIVVFAVAEYLIGQVWCTLWQSAHWKKIYFVNLVFKTSIDHLLMQILSTKARFNLMSRTFEKFKLKNFAFLQEINDSGSETNGPHSTLSWLQSPVS